MILSTRSIANVVSTLVPFVKRTNYAEKLTAPNVIAASRAQKLRSVRNKPLE